MFYHEYEWRSSRIHLLTVSLDEYEVRPVLAAEAFPFLRIYPVIKAVEQGAVASIGGGYNTTLYHHFPDRVPDEPLHAMVIDNEIWTTGTGGGGAGLLLDHDWASTVEVNSLDIQLSWWNNKVHSRLTIDSMNHGHQGRVIAFTHRGGTNEMPGILVVYDKNGRHEQSIEGKHYVVLSQPPSQWMDYNMNEGQLWAVWDKIVISNGTMVPTIPPGSPVVVLESKWKLPLDPGQTVQWRQRTGAPNVVSGWPQIIRDGLNVVPLLGLHGEASHGPDNWFIRKNPRMVVGVSQDGQTVYLCTVEGRVPNEYASNQEKSVGLRLKELATWLVKMGVWSAVNFDGGGSAFQWIFMGYKGLSFPPAGLAAPGCYNPRETLQGLRPDHFATAVFPRSS